MTGQKSVNVPKDCSDYTEWGVSVGSSDDVSDLSDAVCEYIMFCEDCHPSKNSDYLRRQ